MTSMSRSLNPECIKYIMKTNSSELHKLRINSALALEQELKTRNTCFMPPCAFGQAAVIDTNFLPMALKRRLFHEAVNRFAYKMCMVPRRGIARGDCSTERERQ